MRIILSEGDNVPFVIYVRDLLRHPVNVAGWTATFRFSCGGAPKEERPAVISDPTNPLGGRIEYRTVAGDLKAGEMWWEWTLQDPSNFEVTGPHPREKATVVARL